MALDWAVLRVSLTAVLLAWSAAVIAMVALYALKSLDSVRRLLIAACVAAAPAMWLPPATLLLSSSSPGLVAAGVALILNSTRLLVSHGNPQKAIRKRRKSSRKQQFFTGSARQAGIGPAVAGAISLQAGFGAVWGRLPLLAASLFVAAAAVWTASSIAKGSNTPGTARPFLNGWLSLLLTLILSTAIAVHEFGREPAETYNAGFVRNTMHLWNRMNFGEPAQAAEPKQKVTTVVTRKPEVLFKGNALVPGVIFRPDVKRDARASLFVAPHVVRPLTVARPMSILFTGEYHLFPTSSGGVQKDATVYRGTPLDAEYINTSGGQLETEARQQMQPPIDLAHCGAIQVKLRTGERTPALAFMQLIGEGKTVDLGSEVFGVKGTEQEILEFTIPVDAQNKAREIRLIFRRDPARRHHSAKVAVEGFILLPRGI